MNSLIWFVEEALNYAGLPADDWEKMPRVRQTEILRQWQTDCDIKFDPVMKANFKPQLETIPIKPYGTVMLSHSCAEYAAVLIGQVKWGNRERRRQAAAELGAIKLVNAQDCFARPGERNDQ